MSIDSIGSISQEILYGTLNPIFGAKLATIKGHSSTEPTKENFEQTYSQDDFIVRGSSQKADVESIVSAGAARTKEVSYKDFPNVNNLKEVNTDSNFSSSNMVKSAIERGYSPQEALTMAQVTNSYTKAKDVGIANFLASHTHTV